MIAHLSGAQRKAILQLLVGHLRQRAPEASGGLKEQAALVEALEDEAKASRRQRYLALIWLSLAAGVGGGTVAALLIAMCLRSALGFWVWPVAVIVWLIAAGVGGVVALGISLDLDLKLDRDVLYEIALRCPEGWIYRELAEEVENHRFVLKMAQDFREFLTSGGKISGSQVFLDPALLADPLNSLPRSFKALLKVLDAKTLPQWTSANDPDYFYRLGMLAWKGKELPADRRLTVATPASGSAGGVWAIVAEAWAATSLRKGIADACLRECLQQGWFNDSEEKLASIRDFYLRRIKGDERDLRDSLSERSPGTSQSNWHFAQWCVSLVEMILAAMPNQEDLKHAVRYCDQAIELDPSGPSGLRARCLKSVLPRLKPHRWATGLSQMIVCKECKTIEIVQDPSRRAAQLCEKHAKKISEKG